MFRHLRVERFHWWCPSKHHIVDQYTGRTSHVEAFARRNILRNTPGYGFVIDACVESIDVSNPGHRSEIHPGLFADRILHCEERAMKLCELVMLRRALCRHRCCKRGRVHLLQGVMAIEHGHRFWEAVEHLCQALVQHLAEWTLVIGKDNYPHRAATFT